MRRDQELHSECSSCTGFPKITLIVEFLEILLRFGGGVVFYRGSIFPRNFIVNIRPVWSDWRGSKRRFLRWNPPESLQNGEFGGKKEKPEAQASGVDTANNLRLSVCCVRCQFFFHGSFHFFFGASRSCCCRVPAWRACASRRPAVVFSNAVVSCVI